MSGRQTNEATRRAFGLPGQPREGVSPFDGLDAPSFPDAVCAQMDGDLWFSPEVGNRSIPKREAAAVARCHTCPHELDCADYAVTNRIEYGVWGGLTEADRKTIWAQEDEAA